MEKIFVSIACFMDIDIVNTIEDCLKQAKHPERIIFGICYQYDPTDEDCLQIYNNNKQFRINRIHYNESKGPTYARGIIYNMFKDEDYYFQIDCHTRFFKNWDTKVIACLNECKKRNNKAILSYYPFDTNTKTVNKKSIAICDTSKIGVISEKLGIRTGSKLVLLKRCPKKNLDISAAMLFFDKNAYNDVVFDDTLYHGYHFEEQTLLAIRYWTSGYDIFTPSNHIILTEYKTNRKRLKIQPFLNIKMKQNSFDLTCHRLKLKYNSKFKNYNKSLLGNERSVEDYFKMIGIVDKLNEVFPNNFLQFNKDN